MFTLRLTSSIIIIACLGGLFFNSHTDATKDWTTSESECMKRITDIDSIEKFIEFTADLNLALKSNTDQQQIIQTINRCVRSVDGLGDIKSLELIVGELLPKIHSVCEPDFISKLLLFSKQIRDNRTKKKILKVNRSSNRLSRFFRLLIGQVIVTCKKSLATKLEQAEQKDEAAQSLKIVDEMVNQKDVSIDDLPFSRSMRYLVKKIIENRSWVTVLPENILLAESIKSPSGEPLFAHVTLNSLEMLEHFAKVKEACLIIDHFAESSINPIAKLAVEGYFARDKSQIVDNSLKSNPIVTRWLNAVQYCQSVFIIKAHVDIEGDIPESLKWEELNRDKTGLFEWHRYQDNIDMIDKLDSDIQIFTTPTSGVKAWFWRRLGRIDKKLSEIILKKLNMNQDQNSIFSEVDTEGDVKFGGGTTMLTNHVVTASTAVAHHASTIPLWQHNLLAAGLWICIGGVAFLSIILIVMVATGRTKDTSYFRS